MYKTVAQKIIEEKGFRVELLVMDKDGKDYYYYIILKEANYKSFLDAVNSKQPMNPKDFGEVLFSGEGSEPKQTEKDLIEYIFKING